MKKTKGLKWFDLPTMEKIVEIENYLEVLCVHSILDLEYFYKKNDLKVLVKYFQSGKDQYKNQL